MDKGAEEEDYEEQAQPMSRNREQQQRARQRQFQSRVYDTTSSPTLDHEEQQDDFRAPHPRYPEMPTLPDLSLQQSTTETLETQERWNGLSALLQEKSLYHGLSEEALRRAEQRYPMEAPRQAQHQWQSSDVSEQLHQQILEQGSLSSSTKFGFSMPHTLAEFGHLLQRPLHYVPPVIHRRFRRHNYGRELMLAFDSLSCVPVARRPWRPLSYHRQQYRNVGLLTAMDHVTQGQFYVFECRFMLLDEQLDEQQQYTEAEKTARLRDRNQEVPDASRRETSKQYREQHAQRELQLRATDQLLRQLAEDTSAESRTHFTSFLEDQTRVYVVLQPHADNTVLTEPSWKMMEHGRPVPQNRFRFVLYFVTIN